MDADEGNNQQTGDTEAQTAAILTLEGKAERRLIRPGGSHRHIDYSIHVGHLPQTQRMERPPLVISLVLDRSGSMSGEKIVTAKAAALAVVDRLEAQDQVAVVVFDDKIDVVQPVASATPDVKKGIREALSRIEARASTALHEGWLVGCKTIAGDSLPRGGALARCFLLTDGLANVGLTDPEQIASDAAGIRQNAGISTSTFGIGPDYAEELLGPMAVAGGGQFHPLRTTADIASTFIGELGEMLSVAAGNARLELDGGRDITVEIVSEYRALQPVPGLSTVSVLVGDLPAGDERHVVVRFGFPAHGDLDVRTIQARVVWSAGGRDYSTPWQETRFAYADNAACDAERREHQDAAVMHWVGLHYAQRAKKEATLLSKRGDLNGARALLEGVARRIAEYARSDSDLQAAVKELRALAVELAERPVDTLTSKETYYQTLRTSRGQKDFRRP